MIFNYYLNYRLISHWLMVITDYSFKFWAKGSVNGMKANFIQNGNPWTNYHSQLFTLSDSWTEYTFDFISLELVQM